MSDSPRRNSRIGLAGLVVVGVLVVGWWWWCGIATTLLLVRHADRVPPQDQLSAAGISRAQELVRVAQKAGVTAIYHSDANRTRQTAQPLATALDLTPIEMPAAAVEALVDDVFANHPGSTVLIVGHSNTVPAIIAQAGGPTLPDIDDLEFDNLFVLTVCRCGRSRATAVNLQYGAVSP